MTLTNLLHRYVSYNFWANKRLADLLSKLPEDFVNQEITSSFPSIRKTILHNYGAEYLWLQRLNGNSPSSFPPAEVAGWSTSEVFENWVKNAADFRDEIRSKDAEYFSEICKYRFLNGTETELLRAEIVQHCMNHSTFHRGQIIMMARQLGLTEIPGTDFSTFCRENP